MSFLRCQCWAGLLCLIVGGCGLRSTPEGSLICSDDDDAEDTGGEARSGSCENPIVLPYQALTVKGRLGGCSGSDGWCGADRGPEDVYLLSFPAVGDAVVSIDPDGTTFSPTLRVVKHDDSDPEFDPCAAPPVGVTEVCAPEADSRASWPSFLEAGDYYIIVDSEGYAADMEYEFEIAFGQSVVPEDCPKLPDTIVLGTGGVYQWEDTLARGQGRLDGNCHAPGAEHTWNLQLKSGGLLRASVVGQGDLEPVLGVRPKCSGKKEIICDASTASSGTSNIELPLAAGNYLLNLDQQSVTGGAYTLTVSLD